MIYNDCKLNVDKLCYWKCLSSSGVEVKIGAAPVDGEANTELIAFLAKLFSIRKSGENHSKDQLKL